MSAAPPAKKKRHLGRTAALIFIAILVVSVVYLYFESPQMLRITVYKTEVNGKTFTEKGGSLIHVVTFNVDYSGTVRITGSSSSSDAYIFYNQTVGGTPETFEFATGAFVYILVFPATVNIYFGTHDNSTLDTETLTITYIS